MRDRLAAVFTRRSLGLTTLHALGLEDDQALRSLLVQVLRRCRGDIAVIALPDAATLDMLVIGAHEPGGLRGVGRRSCGSPVARRLGARPWHGAGA